MNTCIVSGLIGEAEDRQISGYTHGRNRENGRVVAEDSNGRVTELMESVVSARQIAKCHKYWE
jgi:hypothetical protein